MGALEYIIGSVLILFSLIIIFVVLLQEGRQANVGVISGAADSFMDKGAAKSLDQKLSKWTKVIAIAFFAVVLAGMLVTNFVGKEEAKPSTGVSQNDSTNDAELDWSESDKKDEDKKEESDKKDDADKKEDADKKADADKKN